MDNEPQWKYYLATIDRLCAPLGASVDFSLCDVVRDVAESPEAVGAKFTRADLIIFSYVCHETSDAAAAACHRFYRGLTHRCKDGVLLLFFDVIGRSAKCFDDLHTAMVSEIEGATPIDEGAAAGSELGHGARPKSSVTRAQTLRRIPLPAGICVRLHAEVMMLHVTTSVL